MNAVVFESYEAARAAFDLGPVIFKCRVCGKSHDSKKSGFRYCLMKAQSLLREGKQLDACYVPLAPWELWDMLPVLPLWGVLNRFEESRQYYQIQEQLSSLILNIDPFGKDLFHESMLALSDFGYQNALCWIKEQVEQRRREHLDRVGSMAQEFLEWAAYLKKLMSRPDPRIFPVALWFRRDRFGGLDCLLRIDLNGHSLNVEETAHIEYIPVVGWCKDVQLPNGPLELSIRNLLYDVVYRFGLPKPYGTQEGRKWFHALNYSLYDVALRPEGAYFSLQARKSWCRAGDSYSSTSRVYHILFLKDYVEPIKLGEVKNSRTASDIDKALKKLGVAAA